MDGECEVGLRLSRMAGAEIRVDSQDGSLGAADLYDNRQEGV